MVLNESERIKRLSNDIHVDYLLDSHFAKLEIKDSLISGSGVYTKQKIYKGQIICPLFGILYNPANAKINYPKYSYQITDTVSIETENEPGFFNHSCNPNMFINSDWMFQALCDIEENTEVTIDYGCADCYDYNFECTCKTEPCRKIFKGDACKDTNFQKTHGSTFTPYLKNKFNLK